MYKVIHVISDRNIGGAGVLLLGLLRHTDRDRFEPILVLPRGSLLLPRAKQLKVRCIELARGGNQTFSPAAVFALFRILKREEPDLLHTNASLSARVAALPFRHLPCVDTKHCCFPPTKQQQNPASRLAFRLFERVSKVHYIATASAVCDTLRLRGSAGQSIRVISGGSEPPRTLDEAEKSALRNSLDIPPHAFVVGYCARVEAGKGHEHLLETARLLSDEKDLFFLAVGGGSLLPQMKKAAKELSNFKFTGFREDVGDVMNLFDVSLNCSYLSETSSLSLSEGMSLGKPVIVTKIGGNADMARGCGIVVPPRAPRALAAAVLRLKGNHALYRRLSAVAKARYRSHYSSELMTKKVEAYYLSLLDKK